MTPARNRVAWATLAVALAINVATLIPWLPSWHADADAANLYFPLAEALRAKGLAFFANPDSLRAPPVSYAWPALVGTDLDRLKIVHLALSCVTLLMVFRLATLLHSPAAGLAAAVLFAVSPLLRPHLATAVTEPPFILLTVAWCWALAEWHVRGHAAFAAIAGLAFALATLTRASLFYLGPVMVVGFAIAAWRLEGDRRRLALGAALAHLAALGLVGVFIARALVYFDFPFFTTGGGNALYLGVSPLTGGYDSAYLGLAYDVWAVIQAEPSNLTLGAERLLAGTGRMVLAEQPVGPLIAALVQKSFAFVFVTNAELDVQGFRAWRVALVALTAVGLFAIRHGTMRIVLAALLAYQVAIHAPVLYTHRYSVAALDPWLVVGAGIGLAALWGRLRLAGLVAAIVALGIVLGAWLARGPLPEPDVFAAARIKVWESDGQPIALGPQGTTDIEIRDAPRFYRWANHVAVIDATWRGPGAADCGPLRIAYRRTGEPAFSKDVLARPQAKEGPLQRLQVGGIPLDLHAEGTLRLAQACPAGTTLEIAKVAIYQPMGAIDARERFLGEAPRYKYER